MVTEGLSFLDRSQNDNKEPAMKRSGDRVFHTEGTAYVKVQYYKGLPDRAGVKKFLCKEPESKDVRLCGPYGLSHNYSAAIML
jgi:hypothetical protein